MGMAREYKAHPTSRPHTTMTGIMTHHIGPKSVHQPVKGAHTKTDKEPMSTSEYKGHIAKYEKLKNGCGRQ